MPRCIAAAGSIEVTDLGRACVFVACPVIAGVVHLVPRVRRPVRPGARQDVVILGVSPTPLIVSPFSVRAVCLFRLLLFPCRSARLFAISSPFELYQGPVPMRSRAWRMVTALSPARVLRYACHVFVLPIPSASVWHI